MRVRDSRGVDSAGVVPDIGCRCWSSRCIRRGAIGQHEVGQHEVGQHEVGWRSGEKAGRGRPQGGLGGVAAAV